MRANAIDKKRILREQALADAARAREQTRALKAEIARLRVHRRERIAEARERCKAERLAARERARSLRARVLMDLRATLRSEREAARHACTIRLTDARAIRDDVERARAKIAAERQYRADLRRIEAANKARRREAVAPTPRSARASESDDEVRQNIPADMVPLFEKVRRSIRGSGRETRTEAFLRYAEEHPSEVFATIEAETDARMAQLEREHRRASRARSRTPAPRRRAAYDPSEVPF
jgi:hypothetical protein